MARAAEKFRAAEVAAERVAAERRSAEARVDAEQERQAQTVRREVEERLADARRLVEAAQRREVFGIAGSVAANSFSGLARLARCAGVVLAARREGGNSAASVLAEVEGFTALLKELQKLQQSLEVPSPGGCAAMLGGACAAAEKGVQESREQLEAMQREVRRSTQLSRAMEGPASGLDRSAIMNTTGHLSVRGR